MSKFVLKLLLHPQKIVKNRSNNNIAVIPDLKFLLHVQQKKILFKLNSILETLKIICSIYLSNKNVHP